MAIRQKLSFFLLLFGFFFLMFCVSLAQNIVWETGTKIKVEIAPTVVYTPANQNYSYGYELISKPESEQKVETFRVEFKSQIFEILSPSGWEAYDLSKFPARKNLVSWNADFGRDLEPGKKMKGFSITSPAQPGIVQSSALGFVQEMPGAERITSDIPGPPDPFEDCVKMKTIGPDILPSDEPVFSIDRIISLKHEAFSLGWIDNAGIANSLDQKLENAKVKISQGNKNAAKNILQAFINELEAQRGKHINDNAFYLLKLNAEFLISKL